MNSSSPIVPKLDEMLKGGCAPLALRLHHLMQWPLYLLCDADSGELSIEEATDTGIPAVIGTLPGSPRHLVVRHPSGGFIDAAGWWPDRSVDDLKATGMTVEQPTMVAISQREALALVSGARLRSTPSLEGRAVVVAAAIIELEKTGAPFNAAVITAELGW